MSGVVKKISEDGDGAPTSKSLPNSPIYSKNLHNFPNYPKNASGCPKTLPFSQPGSKSPKISPTPLIGPKISPNSPIGQKISPTPLIGPKSSPKFLIKTNPLALSDRIKCKEASELFNVKKYKEAKDILGEVLEKNRENVRLKHNYLISEFVGNGSRGFDEFANKFINILKEAGIDPEDIRPENMSFASLIYNLALIHFQANKPCLVVPLCKFLIKNLSSDSSESTELLDKTKMLLIDTHIVLLQFSEALTILQKNSKSPQELNRVHQRAQEMKILCYISNKDLISAAEEMKTFQNDDKNHNSSGEEILSLLRAYFEYQKNNFRSAMDYLYNTQSSNDEFLRTGDNMKLILNNNIGCCHYAMEKPTIAAWLFQKSSDESNDPQYKDKMSLPIHCLGFAKKYEILYNFGVSLLHAREYLKAFNALSLCTKAFPKNPRLLLRLAQSSLHLYKNSNEEEFSWSDEKRSILRGVSTSSSISPISPNGNSEDDKNSNLASLQYALSCIETSLPLICAESVRRDGILYVEPSKCITSREEVTDLLADVLCTGAYITLRLQKYEYTTKLCHELLSVSLLPNHYANLGHMYLGEALFGMGEIKDSLDCLSHQNYINIQDEISRATIWYNNAVAFVKIGKYVEALDLIERWSERVKMREESLPPDFTILQIHILLKMGDIERARLIYSQHSPGL